MIDQRMEALAMKQHGLITRRQATEHGLTVGGIRHRVRRASWHPTSRDVFRMAGTANTAKQRALAAVFASGPGAALSHRSGAALGDLPGFSIEPIRISVQRNVRRSLAGVTLEESMALLPHHVTIVDGIPCTTVARTLFDLCGDVSAHRVERALDTALARRMVTMSALWGVLTDLAEHGRKGTVLFRQLLQERAEDYVPPESELEARFIALTRAFGLPIPERQVDLGDDDGWIGRVDFLFRGARVVVEVDGAAFHDGLVDRRRDEERDRRLVAASWTVLRFRWDDIVNRPFAVAQSIRFQREFVGL